ncbi:MAG: CoF synthetase, partial [Janthinobacterium sp.]
TLEGETVAVFADVLTRAFAQALPPDCDYRLVQQGGATLQLHAAQDAAGLAALRLHLENVLRGLGVAVERLDWTVGGELPAFDPTMKRRRIRRLA